MSDSIGRSWSEQNKHLIAGGNRAEAAWLALAVGCGLAIPFIDLREVICLLVIVALGLVALNKPIVAVSALVASVPLQEKWQVHLGGLESTWTRIVLGILVFAWFVRWTLHREALHIPASGWVFAGYVAVLVLSVINAQSIGDWAGEVYRWAVAGLVFILSANLIRSRGDFVWVFGGLVLGVSGSLVIALKQVVTASGPETFEQRGFTRAYGFFGEPNPFAAYLAMASLPLIAAGLTVFTWRQGATRALFLVALLVGFGGAGTLLLTQSRGGLLGFGAGVAVLAWVIFPCWGRRVVLAGGVTGILLLVTPQFEGLRAALGIEALFRSGPTAVTPENWAVEERLAHWGAAAAMWSSEPWSGIGAGNFGERFREFTPTWRFRISRGHAHSAYLQAAAQAGTLGLVGFLLLLCTITNRTVASLQNAGQNARGVHAGVLAVTVAVAVHGIFDYVHVLSLSLVLSVVWAMSAASWNWSEGETVTHVGN